MFWYWLVVGLWVFWLMIYWRGGLDILSDIRSAKSVRDRVYLVALTVATIGIVLTSNWLTLQVEEAHPLVPLGAGFVLLGVGGTFYCRQYLGQFWTAENTLQDNHRVVDTGHYAYVRHPIYTFAILLYSGTGIAFPVWWQVALVVVVIIIYVLKTTLEDRFLALNLAGYAEYQARVSYRLVPQVW